VGKDDVYRLDLSREGQAAKPILTEHAVGQGGELVRYVISRDGLTAGMYQLRIFVGAKPGGGSGIQVRGERLIVNSAIQGSRPCLLG